MKRNNPFIVAELSGNHAGSFTLAMDLIEAAKNCGADAVKFQTFFPQEMAVNVPIQGGPWDGRKYHELYAETYLPWKWHAELFQAVRDLGMVPFSTPFSPEAVARLETIDCPIYKIASAEIGYKQLIAAAAQTRKPMIISTGMASLSEICRARSFAIANGCFDITALHCISAYPARAADFNMRTMTGLIGHGFKVGLSDHSLDSTAAISACALGATVIEKHLCLRRSWGGPDAAFSLEPREFAAMVNACRDAAAALGNVTYGCREAERESYQYRRSIWVVKDLAPGQVITESDLAILRPNYGLDPQEWDSIIGRKAKISVLANSPMSKEFLE